MPLVSSSIANLVNGVSQQPYTLRLASQSEIQENGLSTVAQGLKKRPPTKHIKRLSASAPGAFIHTIKRDEFEKYRVVITDGSLKVYDFNGTAKTVNFPNGKPYITTTGMTDPQGNIRALTVADYTFIVNKAYMVSPSASTVPVRPPEALIVVKTGLYSKTYKVVVNGTTFSFATPDGTVASHATQIATDYIAGQLTAAIAGGGTGVTATQNGSVIYLTKVGDFTLSTSDGYADTAMYAVKGRLQRFSDLPANAGVQDFTVEIVGDKTSSFDDYWVRYDKASGTGVWRETIKPGLNLGFNNLTMPWALIRESDGTFTFKPLTWAPRVVGDDDSAPQPSFVGRKIQSVFFYRNRLGMIADESVSLSEAGSFFNFHPTTVTDLLDSDRIDASASHTKVSNLFAAVPFSKQLLLFSAQTQFVVESGDLLTPRTISIKPTTEFECLTTADPVGAGNKVYFGVPRGAWAGLREYYVDEASGVNDAAEVTSHVPKYIPAGVTKLAAASNEDIICAITKGKPNSIYVYKFYWNNNEKLQSSWSVWTLGETDVILDIEFIESSLQILVNRADGLYLETLDVSEDTTQTDSPYYVHLDRFQQLTPLALTYSAGVTTFNLGWTPLEGSYLAVVTAGTQHPEGTVVPVTFTGSTGRIAGNFSLSYLTVGTKYTFRYRFSTIVPKTKSSAGGEKADNVALLQLRKLQVNFADTGYFQAEVTPQGRPTYVYKFTGKYLGLASATIGEVTLETGSFSFPVMSKNTTVAIELRSDSPLPCAFLSADWEGYYVKRSQGI